MQQSAPILLTAGERPPRAPRGRTSALECFQRDVGLHFSAIRIPPGSSEHAPPSEPPVDVTTRLRAAADRALRAKNGQAHALMLDAIHEIGALREALSRHVGLDHESATTAKAPAVTALSARAFT